MQRQLEAICQKCLEHRLKLRRFAIAELLDSVTLSPPRNDTFDIEAVRLHPIGASREQRTGFTVSGHHQCAQRHPVYGEPVGIDLDSRWEIQAARLAGNS